MFNQVFPWVCTGCLLHTLYYNPAQVDMAALFKRARPLQVEVRGCIELFHRRSNRLRLCTFGAAPMAITEPCIIILGLVPGSAPQPGLDWDAIVRRAREWRSSHPLRTRPAVPVQLWPGLVPVAALQQVMALSPVFLERFFCQLVDRKTANRPSFEYLLIWVTTPGLGRRFEMAFKMIFPSPAYLQNRYGAPPVGFWPLPLFPLAVPVDPVDE